MSSFLKKQLNLLIEPQKMNRLSEHWSLKLFSLKWITWASVIVGAGSFTWLVSPKGNLFFIASGILVFITLAFCVLVWTMIPVQKLAYRLWDLNPDAAVRCECSAQEKIQLIEKLERLKSMIGPDIYQKIICVIKYQQGGDLWWLHLHHALILLEKEEIEKQYELQKKANEDLLITKVNGLDMVSLEQEKLVLPRVSMLSMDKKSQII